MKVLIVDENATNLKILSMLLAKDNYDVKTANSSDSALAKMSKSFDLVILDTNLSDRNGFDTCKKIKENPEFRSIPIILISRESRTDDIVKAFASGANDLMTTPFRPEDVRERIAKQIKLRDLQNSADKSEVERITNEQMETIFSLAKLAQSKDDDTGHHLERVKRYCKILAVELTKPIYKQEITRQFIKDLELAAPLHDVGKVGIADEIVLKPDKLTEAEFEQMKQHTIIGYNMLKDVQNQFGDSKFIKMAMNIARYHHERYDGTGYPNGLSKTDIPLEARILAVADVYDALRTQKPYHDSISHEKAFEVIKGGRELQFDYMMVKALKKVHHEFEKVWDELGD